MKLYISFETLLLLASLSTKGFSFTFFSMSHLFLPVKYSYLKSSSYAMQPSDHTSTFEV